MVGGLDKQIKEIKEVIELPVNILSCLMLLVLPNQKECYFMDHQALERLFLLGLLLITLSAPLSECQDLSLSRNLLVKAAEWSGNCSSWLESTPLASSSWMRLTALEVQE